VTIEQEVSAVVLAGGMGRRMNGVDKGLVELAGRPMVGYVIDTLRKNVSSVLVNANRNQSSYEAFGARVVADSIEGYQGPLAGVEAAMSVVTTNWLYTCPCDSPLQPAALLPHIWQQVQTAGADIGMAHDGQRSQPVFSLISVALLPSLQDYLQRGERKIDRWFESHNMLQVDCSDYAQGFVNINTEAQKLQIEQELKSAWQ
jgi:molybdenum cofactor guanylyltransferase